MKDCGSFCLASNGESCDVFKIIQCSEIRRTCEKSDDSRFKSSKFPDLGAEPYMKLAYGQAQRHPWVSSWRYSGDLKDQKQE